MKSLYDDIYIRRSIKGDYRGLNDIDLNIFETILMLLVKLGMSVCQVMIFVICNTPIISSLFETFARCYSRGAVGFFLRGAYYSNKLKRMGKNVFIDVGVTIWEPKNVEIDDETHLDTYVNVLGGERVKGFVKIGKYVHVASFCVLAGRGGIEIGDYAAVAAGSCIYSGSNHYRNSIDKNEKLISMSAQAPIDMQYVVEKKVVIGDYAFIGVNSTVMPGVTVGKASVIGAGSIVIEDIPAFKIAVGAPAKVIKQRPSSVEITVNQ
jgi:acetyltransferase-like isoleucine patch superfamily enzyme